jgi:N-acetylneuraminate synthase
VDSAFSLEPAELKQLCIETERAWQALGGVHFGGSAAEQASKAFRRSLYITEDLKAGERLTPANLRAIRPGFGLPPKHLDELMGATVVRDVSRGTPADWSLVRSAA